MRVDDSCHQWYHHDKLGSIEKYDGYCVKCGVELSYDKTIYTMEVERTDEYYTFLVLNNLRCPVCFAEIRNLKLWKSMNITKELETIKHESTGTRP